MLLQHCNEQSVFHTPDNRFSFWFGEVALGRPFLFYITDIQLVEF